MFVLSWVGLLELNILATSKVISGKVLIYDNVHSCRFHSAAPLRDQSTRTIMWYPTQSHYPDTEPMRRCPILIMLSAWLGSDKHGFLKHWFNSTRVKPMGSNPMIYQNGRRMFNLFGHPVWCFLSWKCRQQSDQRMKQEQHSPPNPLSFKCWSRRVGRRCNTNTRDCFQHQLCD